MQGINNQGQLIEEGITKEDFLRTLPLELVGEVAEDAWIGMSLDQKKEILRKKGIFEKYVSQEISPVESGEHGTQQIDVPVRQEVLVSEEKTEKFGGDEFEKAVEEVKNIEKDKVVEEIETLSQEEQGRIEEEKSTSANTGNYKFFGYQPSSQTFVNPKQISDDNPVIDSKTWAATIVAKILGLFQ